MLRATALVPRDGQARVALFVLLMAGACALLLALPGQTATAKYVNDLLIFLDGAHRIVSGQVPNRDFHSALGPVVYFIPALGLLLTGSLGAAMPVGMAVVIVVVAPVMAHVLASRLRPAIALPFAAFLLIILAVPLNLGEGFVSVTFGMFYNRIGWSLLSLLLVMYLPPAIANGRQTSLDAVCAAVVVALLAYMKASYGAVAGAFLVFMLVVSRQRAWAALAISIAAGAALLIEIFWHGSREYVGDLLLASEVSGGLQGGLDGPFVSLLRNFTDYVVFALFAGVALWHRRSPRDLLFYGFCGLAGFLLIRQNFQTWGIITLYAGAAVAAETLGREAEVAFAGDRRWPGRGAQLLLVAFTLPPMVHSSVALALHVNGATARPVATFALPKFDRLRLVDYGTPGDNSFFTLYAGTLQDGARAIEALGPNPGKVFVLDFVNAFSAGLGLAPPRGDSPWHHFERTFDKQHFIPAESLLRDVRIVMEPKVSVEEGTFQALREVYATYLAANFELARETEFWKVYRARGGEGVASAHGL